MFTQFNNNHKEATSPISFESVDACYKSTLWKSKGENLTYKVIKYNNKYDVEVLCLELGNIMHVSLAALRFGHIKNPYFRGKYGGYFGEGPYTKHGNPKAYNTWANIHKRLAEENQYTSRNKAYTGTVIDENWHNFQVFADWYEKYIGLLNPKYYNKYQIDKDILTWDTNIKLYSPQTCCIVPEQINIACANLYRDRYVESNLPMGVHANSSSKSSSYTINISLYGESPYPGTFETPEEAFMVYKQTKEKYLKELADFYYNENAILKNVYDALYSIDIKPFKTF